MTLAAGTRLGPYEVTAPIGVGGMGEVYRATDTNLGRQVAIKVLPEAFAHDADRLARFEREAKTLASLNHPNIAQIHGLEKSGGKTALVMELVDGPTLADRIAQGAIPIEEALPIAKQIAEALEAAHEQGIIHRDLKPANIKVRPDGTVKVLDFGLAKALGPAEAGHYVPGGAPDGRGVRLQPDLSQLPTITSPAMMTGVGMILGTAAYMSPEQARGKAVDKRSDIWAFGSVLYEMLTGKRAFDGEDVAETLANVLRIDPDWSVLPADLPLAIRALLQGCLTRDHRRRVADISTALFVLEKGVSLAPPAGKVSTAPPSRRPLWRRALPIGAALFVGSLLTVLGEIYTRAAPEDLVETRLEITTPPGRPSFSRLSPDGRKIVFSAAAEGKPSQLWLRPFESEAAQPLSGTQGAAFPFWSPDSQSLGFIASGKLMRLDLAGGTARSLADAPSGSAGAWGPDGTILYTPTATSALYGVPAAGGLSVEVTHLSTPAEASHRFPDFLPDGRHFLFFVAGTEDSQGVYLGSLDASGTRRLLQSDTAAVFAAPDHVLFSRQGSLLAQRVDLTTFEGKGDSFSLADRVAGDQGIVGEIAVSTSRTGVIAYRVPISDPRQYTWFDRMGRQAASLGDLYSTAPGAAGPRISPDGRTVAVGRWVDRNLDVWLIETARGVIRRFTSDPLIDDVPIWSPDNTRIVFLSRRAGPTNLWLKRIDGGVEERLRQSVTNETPLDWSPDGRFILFRTQGVGGADLWALPLEGDRKPVAVATTSFGEGDGRFSPDSRRVAYQSNESGRDEIYVVPFPGSGIPTQVSTTGGVTPQWREDGREIFYLGPDRQLMVVSVKTQPNGKLDLGLPVALFSIPEGAGYDITRDGQRILINKPVGQATTPPITIIQNWQPGLPARER